MKAIRMYEYGGPQVLRFEEVEAPSPGDGEVLVRIHAAGVNPIDYKIRAGFRKEKVALTFHGPPASTSRA
jgi:NADPH:quinone reductase-like Zn-dependent oxidoreductase